MRGWSGFHWGRWRGMPGWSGFHVLFVCSCIGLKAPSQAMRYVTLLERQASHWVRKPGATAPPLREFRPLDFGVNRSLLLGWHLRAKQGHTDAQPKRAGCPSGAGARISWWASQPRSIRLGMVEPEELPVRRVGVWSGRHCDCGTRRRNCLCGALTCCPRDRRAGGTRGTAATSTDNRHGQQPPPQARTTTAATDADTRHRHSQKTERGRPIWGGPSMLSERRYQKRAALDWSVCW